MYLKQNIFGQKKQLYKISMSMDKIIIHYVLPTVKKIVNQISVPFLLTQRKSKNI